MKKINFKQPKYILPLVVFLPLVFLGYTLTNLFGGGNEDVKTGVVTDNINMSLPDAAHQEMGDKMTEMSKRFSEDGAYTAIGALGDDNEAKDSTMSGYGEQEMNQIRIGRGRRRPGIPVKSRIGIGDRLILRTRGVCDGRRFRRDA